jgi:antitoxin StbD
MKLISVSEAKAKLTALVQSSKTEDVALLRYGHPEAYILSAERYEELMDRLEDLDDSLAVEQFRRNPEPTMEAGEFFRRLRKDESVSA